ncbi:MAG: T9SS type A sorting domain-containing protein [Chitinophagales bacterium]
MKKVILLVAAIGFSISSFATHIIGGEMSYQYLGNNVYHVTLKVYRDCLNGVPGFDDPAIIAAYDAGNNLMGTYFLPLGTVYSIPVSLGCSSIPINICAEGTTYEIDITLPPSPNGYTLDYQRCCRSGIIENLLTPLEVGMTFTTSISDPTLAPGNSSPVFNDYPPTAFCVGIPIYFDHSASDPDGDSLSYELCDGLGGGDDINPYPNPPGAPPFESTIYLPPYSGAYPFDADPPLAINPTTGLITGTPASIGVFTLGVIAKEYRNGNLIGEHRRELAEIYTFPGLPTGVSNIVANADLVIYPVPTSNVLNIVSISSNKIKEVKIFDLAGRLLYSEMVKSGNDPITLSLGNFSNGEYHLQMISEGTVQTQAFVITK